MFPQITAELFQFAAKPHWSPGLLVSALGTEWRWTVVPSRASFSSEAGKRETIYQQVKQGCPGSEPKGVQLGRDQSGKGGMGMHARAGSISLETAFGYRPVSGKVKATDARLLILGPVALDSQTAATIQARQRILFLLERQLSPTQKEKFSFFFFQSLYAKQLWIQVSKISHYLVNWRRFAKSISILMLAADSVNLPVSHILSKNS